MNSEISSLVSMFEQWRSSKAHRNVSIPDYLWDEIRKVHKKYPDLNLKNLLCLNPKSWKKFVLSESLTESPFLEIPPLSEGKSATTPSSKRGSVQILVNNIQITIFG